MAYISALFLCHRWFQILLAMRPSSPRWAAKWKCRSCWWVIVEIYPHHELGPLHEFELGWRIRELAYRKRIRFLKQIVFSRFNVGYDYNLWTTFLFIYTHCCICLQCLLYFYKRFFTETPISNIFANQSIKKSIWQGHGYLLLNYCSVSLLYIVYLCCCYTSMFF